MKTCNVCKQTKPLDDFYVMRASPDGKAYTCKACQKAYKKKLRTDDPLYERKQSLQKLYGLTLEDYDMMWDAQNGVCAVCGQPETDKQKGVVRRLSVDHDHDTGEVRGLLCNSCNRAIGLMNDDPERLRLAAEYLE